MKRRRDTTTRGIRNFFPRRFMTRAPRLRVARSSKKHVRTSRLGSLVDRSAQAAPRNGPPWRACHGEQEGAGRLSSDRGGPRMIDQPIQSLPWAAILAELAKLSGEEARRCGVHPQETEDAVQDTFRRVFEIGAAKLPACLVGEDRGIWLRAVVHNAILRIRDAERRWRRQTQTPLAAASRAAALQWPRHPGARMKALDLSRLLPEEIHVVSLLHLGLRVEQIAEIDGRAPHEVLRRALWGGLRGQEPPGRVPDSVGRMLGSIAGIRGRERREWIALMDRHYWPDAIIAEELGITCNALRLARMHGQPPSPPGGIER